MIKINKQSFEELMREESLSATKFAEKVGISRSQFWRILNERSSVGEGFISKFKRQYPNEPFEKYFFSDSVA